MFIFKFWLEYILLGHEFETKLFGELKSTDWDNVDLKNIINSFKYINK